MLEGKSVFSSSVKDIAQGEALKGRLWGKHVDILIAGSVRQLAVFILKVNIEYRKSTAVSISGQIA
jgi:hypothetical protein